MSDDIEDIVAMARAAYRDDRLADGALYGKLADEIERLRAERNALKSSAREFLTTIGAAIKTGEFHMSGSADMCHFVRQAMQKLDVLAFDREEKRPIGLERLHDEVKL
jgi:hypothetical protein